LVSSAGITRPCGASGHQSSASKTGTAVAGVARAEKEASRNSTSAKGQEKATTIKLIAEREKSLELAPLVPVADERFRAQIEVGEANRRNSTWRGALPFWN